MKRRKGRAWITLAIGVAVSTLVLVALAGNAFLSVEGLCFDFMQRLRGERDLHEDVVVVAIDAESVDRYGRWPWPRTILADLVDRLTASGARIIALDIVLSEPSRHGEDFDLRSEDLRLASAMERSGRTILSFFFRRDEPLPPADPPPDDPAFRSDPENILPTSFDLGGGREGAFDPLPPYEGAEPNLNLFAGAALSQGFTTNLRESGVSRRQALVARYEGFVFPALPLRAVAEYRGMSLDLRMNRSLPEVLLGGEPLELDGRSRLLLAYPGPKESFRPVPVWEVIEGRVERKDLDGKMVFVGATEIGIGDFTATPFGAEVPGVMVHATVADNLLGGKLLRETGAPQVLSFVAVLLMGPLVAYRVLRMERYVTGSVIAVALVLAWPVVCFVAFVAAGWHLQIVAPTAAGLLALVAALPYQVLRVDEKAQEIRKTFERFVSPAVVQEMLADPERVELGGERRELTVLFCDIRGFTSISEALEPEEVTDLLNRFFTPMTRLVTDQGGTLDKYMGDALMAFFGAPLPQGDHAARACRAALAMRTELTRLNAAWREEGRLPEGAALGIGIGLNSGEMSVGNMGSEQVRDYTVIGDQVNLGSRVEGLNKLHGTELLVTGATARAAGEGFLARELDRVRVKGKREAVEIFELLAERPAPAELEERVERFARAVALYRERRFSEAAAVFRELAETARETPDRPAEILAERCARLAETPPPEDWDAVETLTSK